MISRSSLHRRPGKAPLRRVALFSDCTDAELARIDSLLTCLRVRPGEVLIREGGVGREFMIIEDGWAQVARDGVELGILGPGSFVGEMALMGQALRSATVTAISPMVVDVLNPGEFRTLLREVPSVRNRITTAADERLASHEAQADDR